ncbi:GNAT family N-acetyltransferase [Paenibacillus sp. SYP-B4298]|uniref:GNAT family N-acetyltransferase n=1 Tax=Paenibacillus sp. SYP-B4298 TaxID=2996034 RepID=UPI0022DE381A|nr:GNAT family N-acetyltransferase [Paenibacillus sp. SYP-B4298]
MNTKENQIQLLRAEEHDKPVIRNLMQYYQYDTTEYNNEDPSPFGLFDYNYLDHYWTDHGKETEGRVAYIIKIRGNLAGFAMVNNFSVINCDSNAKTIAEFFIMRKWRKQGIGRNVALRIFDTHMGGWEVKQEKENLIAQKFWESVVKQYTNGRYNKQESYEPKWDGPIIYFNKQ